MEFIDYYKILELSNTATEAEIKSSYRKLARKYHPDLNPTDVHAKKKFQQINEANEVLSDPEKRKKYDKYGKDWQHAEAFEKAGQQQHQSNRSRSTQQGQHEFDGDFSDFFESMFGGGSRRGEGNTKFRGQDLNANLELNIKDIYKDKPNTFTINGKNIRITIPAGVEDGQTIKLNGHGSPGMNGGPNGDLYITFSVINNTPFKREGSNLYTSVDLNLYTAILGGTIQVDTFDGKVKLNVTPGTQNGTKVKLSGKGFPVYKQAGKFGDLYITYNIKLPNRLTEQERKLFEELAKLEGNEK